MKCISKALSLLRDAEVPFHADFIGEGLEMLKPLIDSFHLSDAISLHPPLSSNEMNEWMDKSSVLVQPQSVE
jgi:hypothetical protein